MVGIPGKSKGCHTCRRRKVKCDEGKPKCSRCVKAGLECQGYVKRAVFLNRTMKGLVKRERLEEIVVNSSMVDEPQSDQSGWRSLATSLIPEVALSDEQPISDDSFNAGTEVIHLHGLIDWTCKFFEPSYNSAAAVYDQALGTNPILDKSEDSSHVLGDHAMTAMLKAARYNSMTAMIKQVAVDSSFVNFQWQDFVDVYSLDALEHTLYDIGFNLAALIQDLASIIENVGQITTTVPELIQNSLKIDLALKEWFVDYEVWCAPSPVYWNSTNPVELGTSTVLELPLLSFFHTSIAHDMMDYWALNIIFGRIVSQISCIIKDHLHFITSVQQEEQLALFNEMAALNCNNSQVLHALKILACVRYCNQREIDTTAGDQLFGIETALNLFRMLPGNYAKYLEQKTVKILQNLEIPEFRFDETIMPSISSGIWTYAPHFEYEDPSIMYSQLEKVYCEAGGAISFDENFGQDLMLLPDAHLFLSDLSFHRAEGR